MYRIYADSTLIYDSTLDDYKIGKGQVSLETNKSGSFVFSIYPDHPFYDNFIRLRTIITVYKGNRIIFRGRILNDVTDYWNNKVITCEGELGFLRDSVVRPFDFQGTVEEFFTQWIENHNSQVDEFKRFKIGDITVVSSKEQISRYSKLYQTTFKSMSDRLTGNDLLGGFFKITHGSDDSDLLPTINYVYDFSTAATQTIEFGSNLKDYVKTVKADDIATVIIPLGAELDDGNESGEEIEKARLNIAEVNGGVDYLIDEAAVAKYGWICKTVTWDNVTTAATLKRKGEEYLQSVVNQNITVEVKAIDLHLLDKSIESFRLGDYIRVISEPHNFDQTLLCNKLTIDLLKPENDTLVLGYTYSTFTETTNKTSSSVSGVVNNLSNRLTVLNQTVKKESEKISQNTLAIEKLESGGHEQIRNIFVIAKDEAEPIGENGDIYIVYEPGETPWKNVLSMKVYVFEPLLPEGYTQVEYIQSSKTQWINTGYMAKYGDVVSVDMAFLDTQSYLGFYSSNTNRFGIGVASGRYEIVNGSNSSLVRHTSDTERHKFVIDTTGEILVDETSYTVAAMTTDFSAAYSFTLFGRKQGATEATSYRGNHRVYGFSVTNGGVLIMNLIPCTNPEGIAGMYDTVGKTFYKNAGSGTFTVG